MSSTLVYNVARHESGQTPPQQFDGNGIPILAGNDRGMMQINVQWGNVTLFAWNWVRNVEEGRRLLKDAVRESIQYVRNRYLEHPTLPDLTDVQCRRNGLSQYNSPNFYYGPNGDFTGWVRLSHPGVTYSDAIITRDPNE